MVSWEIVRIMYQCTLLTWSSVPLARDESAAYKSSRFSSTSRSPYKLCIPSLFVYVRSWIGSPAARHTHETQWWIVNTTSSSTYGFNAGINTFGPRDSRFNIQHLTFNIGSADWALGCFRLLYSHWHNMYRYYVFYRQVETIAEIGHHSALVQLKGPNSCFRLLQDLAPHTSIMHLFQTSGLLFCVLNSPSHRWRHLSLLRSQFHPSMLHYLRSHF